MLGDLYFKLALNLHGQNQLDKAETMSRVAIDMYQSNGNQNSVGLMITEILFSEILRGQGEFEEAGKVSWLS